jgi:methionyl-tRNA formyltransferase
MTKIPSATKFAFFGTGQIARYVLEELQRASCTPDLIVTSPDMRQGRGMQPALSPVAKWAEENGVHTLKPEKLDSELTDQLSTRGYPLFVVADYGVILRENILEIPQRGVLNIHPSLLPRLRGPSPIRSAILRDEKVTGVTIMLLDDEMDHGPIIAQKKVEVSDWPPHAKGLEEILARTGGQLLAHIIPLWIAGDIDAHPQNHDVATYTEKLNKSDGEIDLADDPYQNLLKIRAFEGWPGTYTFFERHGKRIRVGIIDAHLENEKLVIDRVKPEGKKEMSYEDFLRAGAQS